MHTASSAKRTCRLSRSAVLYTATVLMPISRQVRITRRAISPRLAIRTFLNMGRRLAGIDQEQRLIVFHGLGVVHQHLHDLAAHVALDLVEELHGLDDADGLALLDAVADVHEH